LKSTHETVSVAESVTSGYLQFSFSQMKDASEFFKGGITAYTLEEKVYLLNVNKEEAEKCDCVSQEIAEKMALQVTKSFNTDWGIAITGYATPVPESEFKIFAYFSFVYKNEVILSKKLELHHKTEAL
ncbi:CinA family protein, partial [Burkholderia sp. SIMBA_045]